MEKSEQTYLFYDIETTGLNPCFDQILQFAAIRTNLKLEELERYEIKIRLNPDALIAPAALITHRISIQQALEGDSEYEGLIKIHRLINTPGTLNLGYNNLSFDDDFLRFSFFRNLLSPYSHQFANQCSRLDLYPLTILYFLHKPQVLKWPEIDSKISLKLENLSHANALTTGPAHDAMVDVQATLGLARKFYQDKNMWDYAIGYFNKSLDIKREEKLTHFLHIQNKAFLQAIIIKSKLGAGLYYQAPVIKLGQHRHYKNQTIWLRIDTEHLAQTTAPSIAETTRIIRKKAGEQEFLLPFVEKYSTYLTTDRKALITNNQIWLQKNPLLFNEICEHHLNYCYPVVPNIDIDASLYTLGFPSTHLESLFKQFHAGSFNEKLKIAELFPDTVRKQQAQRLMARNFFKELNLEAQQTYSEILNHETAIDFRGQYKLTKDKALDEIQELLLSSGSGIDEVQRNLLLEYQDYLKSSIIN